MRFGPTFYDELKAAGVIGLPFSWNPDDMSEPLFYGPGVSKSTQRVIEGVVAAHNPGKSYTSPRDAMKQQIQSATTLDELKPILEKMV